MSLEDTGHVALATLGDLEPAMRVRKKESHRITRIGWLRAAVLGANDGIISTSSLMLGIGASAGHAANIVFAGVAAMVAGAMSMAAGEYVSVSSQADTEKAALDEERLELESDAEAEQRELAAIYVKRGVKPLLARQVAAQMMEKDALGAHAREELGINDISTARPLQAAMSSALSFTTGAIVPLAAAIAIPPQHRVPAIAAASLACLCVLGWVAAHLGGSPSLHSVLRIVLWSSLAMGVTALVGRFFGA